jgi:hypothetical protein
MPFAICGAPTSLDEACFLKVDSMKSTVAILLSTLSVLACSNPSPGDSQITLNRSVPSITRGTIVEANHDLSRKAVRLLDANHPQAYCSAVLIAPRLVLSAKHCFMNPELEKRGLRLSFAEFQFTSIPEKRVLHISGWKGHPLVDLALVQLSEEAPGDYKPIEIRSINSLGIAPLVIAGFGKAGPNIPADGKLRAGIINSASLAIDSTFIEAYLDAPEASICPGDSGGPAFISRDGVYYLVGIASKNDTSCSSYNAFVQPAPFLADLFSGSTARISTTAGISAPDLENRRLNSLIGWQPAYFPNGAEGILVAVVDTGLSVGVAKMLGNVTSGYNSVLRNADTDDHDGHGTGVAGIVAQVAPRVSLIPVKVFLDDGMTGSQAFVEGVIFALQRNAKIINISASFQEANLIEIQRAVGVKRFQNAVFIIAAGNDRHYVNSFTKKWDNVLVVGATTLDSVPQSTNYSAYGPGVDIAAPAGAIDDGITTANISPPGGLRLFNGTSGATPVVSAVAALVARIRPGATGADIKTQLLHGACSLSQLQSYVNGGRFLNVPGALGIGNGCGNN